MDVINITIEDANYNYLVFENNSQISSKITEMGTQSEKIFFIYDICIYAIRFFVAISLPHYNGYYLAKSISRK